MTRAASVLARPSRSVGRSALVEAALNARAAGYDSRGVAAWLGSGQPLPENVRTQLRNIQHAADVLKVSKS
ncbi:MAG TPA: hypothetical protein ENJ56_00955, partial [Anaerolineae bacterium]|nr:hypothetical protein [Anaerolineae bacterium]